MSVQEKMTAIADAIREKTGRSDTLTLDEMAEAIGSISSSGIDTSDATATAADIAKGVTAYAGGQKITGTVKVGNPIHSTGTPSYIVNEVSGSEVKFINIEATAQEDALIRNGSTFRATASASHFGDATAADVREGKTFTSANGVKITGTMIITLDGEPPVAE